MHDQLDMELKENHIIMGIKSDNKNYNVDNFGLVQVDWTDKKVPIDNMEFIIGGQSMDIHYGDWMHTWAELTTSGDKSILLNEMIQCDTLNNTATIPLQFWFCRNPGLALPLIALQYHEVKLTITFASASLCNTPISI